MSSQPYDGLIVPAQNIIGIVFSVYGLALVWPIVFAFKHYFRVLDYLQFMFLWGGVIYNNSYQFSDHLGIAWWEFFPSFFSSVCYNDNFLCAAGGQLTWTICFVGAFIILMIIVNIQKCRRQNLKAEPVYSFFKGILRWTYLPLFYYSVRYIIQCLYNGISEQNLIDLIGGVIVVAVLIIFPIAQLIIYKCIQQPETDKYWSKWIQFWSYTRLGCMATTIAFYDAYRYDSYVPLYVVLPIFVVYDIIYLIGEDFEFKIMGRISYAIGQALIVTMYCLFVWGFDAQGQSFIRLYDLDLFLISAVILLDLVYYIARIIKSIRNKKQEVSPEQKSEEELKKKNNSFDIGDQIENSKVINKNKGNYDNDLHDSRDSINDRYKINNGISNSGSNNNLKNSYDKPARRRR